ncbi:MAG: hypothetical protein KDA55_08790, partial [Planctomycetales bacterium]|nr:hypothetical protein [Planctomycetales bacterium]
MRVQNIQGATNARTRIATFHEFTVTNCRPLDAVQTQPAEAIVESTLIDLCHATRDANTESLATIVIIKSQSDD